MKGSKYKIEEYAPNFLAVLKKHSDNKKSISRAEWLKALKLLPSHGYLIDKLMNVEKYSCHIKEKRMGRYYFYRYRENNKNKSNNTHNNRMNVVQIDSLPPSIFHSLKGKKKIEVESNLSEWKKEHRKKEMGLRECFNCDKHTICEIWHDFFDLFKIKHFIHFKGNDILIECSHFLASNCRNYNYMNDEEDKE